MEQNIRSDSKQPQSSGQIRLYDIGIAKQMGSFIDASEVEGNHKWLFTSGMPGLAENGVLPNSITGQSELAWQNILSLLKAANIGVKTLLR